MFQILKFSYKSIENIYRVNLSHSLTAKLSDFIKLEGKLQKKEL